MNPRRCIARACANFAACCSLLVFAPRASFAQGAGLGPGDALTVERIYSAPSLSGRPLRDTSWSPDGKWLTYLDQAAGAPGPAIVAVDAATGKRSVLVDPQHLASVWLPPASRGQQTGLGRYAPTRYLWSPDSRSLLFISADELFWYDLAGGKSKTLLAADPGKPAEQNAIDDAKISPDGKSVSFLRNHDIWVIGVSGGPARQITRGGDDAVRHGELDWVYPEELSLLTAYWWSPDSSRIAFLELNEKPVAEYPLTDDLASPPQVTQERFPLAGSANPIARVGVATVATGETRWMDTGTDSTVLLARVVWLRDSTRVAIERFNRAQNRLDLLFAAAATGKSQIVLTEQDQYWINVADDFRFLADGKRFLWSSERSGFRHLYLYDLGGKLLAQLTTGNWEVDGVAGVDEKNGFVYFTSTEKSPIERHFYRVPLAGGAPVQLTGDHGTHNVDLAPDFAHFVDSYSTAMTPPRQDLYNADGSSVAVLEANKVPELDRYRLSPVEFFTVPGADGTPLEAELIRPPEFAPGKKYPVIVYTYGGPQVEQVVTDEWQGDFLLWHEMLAQKGFLVFAVDNRGTTGRGHTFETPIYHDFGKAELADLLAGVAWLKQQSDVDPARIGIWGWSFGGYMTCMAMLRSDAFAAGFSVAPVTDWRLYDTIYTERYMGTPQENPDGYRDSSPVNFAAGLKGKLLIVHATGDDNVHFSNLVELAEKFVQAQKYVDYDIYAGRGHGITDPPARIHMFNGATQFFVKNLAP